MGNYFVRKLSQLVSALNLRLFYLYARFKKDFEHGFAHHNYQFFQLELILLLAIDLFSLFQFLKNKKFI